jgi:ATP-dependent DNA helicase RecQ
MPKALIQGYINQLIDQGLVHRTEGEYPVLTLTDQSVPVLRGQREASLLQPKGELSAAGRSAGPARDDTPLAPDEARVFDALRGLRIAIARERGLPPYVVFHDTVLRELARARPTTLDAMSRIHGIGERKLADLGPRFTSFIADLCREQGIAPDQAVGSAPVPDARRPPVGAASGNRGRYFDLFERGLTIGEAVAQTGHKPGTAAEYLTEFILERKPESVSRWIDDATYRTIVETAVKLGAERFKPIFEHLGGTASYDQIRIVMAHQRALHG